MTASRGEGGQAPTPSSAVRVLLHIRPPRDGEKDGALSTSSEEPVSALARQQQGRGPVLLIAIWPWGCQGC